MRRLLYVLLIAVAASALLGAGYGPGGAGTGGGSPDRQSADCAAETGGVTGEVCQDTALNSLFVCESGPCNGAGWVTYSGAGAGGYTTVDDEGTPLTQRATVNFVGAGVTCADDAVGSETDCTIPQTTDASVLTTGTLPAARLGANSIDAITEIAAALKSGSDPTLVTGTAGAANTLVKWDGTDAVASTCYETSGDLTCTGSITGTQCVGADSDGSNYLELYDNASDDVTAPASPDVRLFTKADGELYVKKNGQASGVSSMLTPHLFVVNIVEENADNYTTKLSLGGYNDECSAASTPFSCCTGTGTGTCAGWTTTVGTSISLDDANDEVDLLDVGTYFIESFVNAGFTAATDECMIFIPYNETAAAEPSILQPAMVGTGDHSDATIRTSGIVPGFAVVEVTTAPVAISIYAAGCGGAYDFPTTNMVGNIGTTPTAVGDGGARLVVRRVK